MLNAPTGEKGTGKADLQNIFSNTNSPKSISIASAESVIK